MNNEPVAWIDKDGNIFYTNGIAHTLPLYTHPVKELTDEEIMALYWRAGWDSDEDVVNFARAILRKAQEK